MDTPNKTTHPYTGPPSPHMVRVINTLTHVNSEGRLYFRTSPEKGWQKIGGPAIKEQYKALNAALDHYRAKAAAL